jgi:cyclic beta-1,2-glucan synthetase
LKDEKHRLSDDAAPLRAELFSASRMAVHARTLAAQHQLAGRPADARLVERFEDNAAAASDALDALSHAARGGARLPAAAECLLDHAWLIEEQVRLARSRPMESGGAALPCLMDAGRPGEPRVYRLALELVAHGDGRVEPESLARFVAAYQEGAPLALDELAAVPDMLRLVLLDNLRRIAVRQADTCRQHALAGHWAARLAATADERPGDLVLRVADMARAVQPLDDGFVAEMTRQLQGRGAALAQAAQWMDAHLADGGRSAEGALQADIGRQDGDRLSAANSIGSLRLLGTMDWREFIETLSAVEQTLRQDPAGVYGRMDGATRDEYRRAVMRLARASGRSETEVAGEALALSSMADGEIGPGRRERHVGHYLIGAGLAHLRRCLEIRPGLAGTLRRHPLPCYLGAAAVLTGLFTAAAVVHAAQGGAGHALLFTLGVLGTLAAGQLALALTDLLAARLVRPRPLPRMDFSGGVPLDARTVVAVPAVLAEAGDGAALCTQLETCYLANRDPGLRFCLLTDLDDAPLPEMIGDDELVARARGTIAALNARYADEAGAGGPFLLLHRARTWNEGEGAWIGRERKRGKLDDLAAFLRDGVRTPFAVVEGAVEGLAETRYLIVLDAGTRLARDGARALAAAMAHPLNRAVLDPTGRRVIAGHGLLQPRMAAEAAPDDASRYQRLCGGEHPGEDGAQPLADVGQDLFGAGASSGQGIYDLALRACVVQGRFPDDRVPSHGLLEAWHLRAGLLRDVALHEACPARYSDDVGRRHRWIRSAWQLGGWLRTRVPAPGAGRVPNPLAPLARWRLLERMRRSLVAPVLAGLLLLCWTRLAAAPFWSAAVLAVFFLPVGLQAVIGLADKPRGLGLRRHLLNWMEDTRTVTLRALLEMSFLPYEAYYSLDAIVRSAWRMGVSRRRLLEWKVPILARSSTDLESTCYTMWFAPAFAVGSALLLSFANPPALFAAAPLLLLWFLSPVLAWWISLPAARPAPALRQDQRRFLHMLARRTWAFFEDHVTAASNWLPPAAIQEYPMRMGADPAAQRTSPTDIGLALLANLAARDFGFVAASGLLQRTRATLQTMARLERHRGHFYKGYDSARLAPLLPLALSTADSGNLAAHLLTLAAGLEQMAEQPVASDRALDGIRATLDVVEASAGDAAPAVRDALDAMRRQLGPEHCRNTYTLPGLSDCLGAPAQAAARLQQLVSEDAGAALHDWAARLAAQCRAAHADLLLMTPWMRAVQEYVIDASLTRIPTLRELAEADARMPAQAPLSPLAAMVGEGAANARARLDEIRLLASQARSFAAMDFGFLYDRATRLLAAGFNVSERRLDGAGHGLLASTARLASFVGIAQDQLPQAHWFALGRPLCLDDGEPLLLSWDGAMQDYLMPLLVMPGWRDTLLDRACRAIVRVQVAHGRRHGIPWGASASACNSVDAAMHYHAGAFGVPGAGMRRGLGEDLVVTPHAAMLALMVEPALACANLERMADLGFMGRYGLYEAVDYTPARLPPGQPYAVVRAFMADHQGMGLLALSHLLHDRPMQRRFEADPRCRAALPLLQEPMPRSDAFACRHVAGRAPRPPLHEPAAAEAVVRTVTRPDEGHPEVQLLSNGRYHAMVSASGAGYSRHHEIALTRWREDPSADDSGWFCYLRDLDSGAVWSTTRQPTAAQADAYKAVFSEGRAEFRRSDHGIALHTAIVVAPDDDVELRRTRIVNASERVRTLELTSYADLVLAPPAVDAAHPAFSRLFLETEILAERGAILCTRRPGAPGAQGDSAPVLLNLMAVHGAAGAAGAAEFETSRAAFLGRGRGHALPLALSSRAPLGGAQGAVLDAAAAIRRRVTLAPGEAVTVDLVLGVAATRDQACRLIDTYRQRQAADRVFELAWTHGQALLRQLDARAADARLYACLAGAVVYPQGALRADAAAVEQAGAQASTPGHAGALPPDLPLVLLRLRDAANLVLARQLLQAHAWWRLKGLAAELVIWCEEGEGPGGYRQALRDQLINLIASGPCAQWLDRPGGVSVRLAAQVPEPERALLQALARVVLSDERGGLAEQLRRAALHKPALPPPLVPDPAYVMPASEQASMQEPELAFDNGIGGFSADGREYLIRLGAGRQTPAPWVNVLASPMFGSVVSESGQACSWNQNAREFRLTPWDNDPVAGRGGEAFYVRDEASGVFWSPTALPAPSGGAYLTRHGFGYSAFEHAAHGIHSELRTHVALDAPLKYMVLKLRNDSAVARRLSVTGYVEWVLGELRAASAPQVLTECDPDGGTLFARNPCSTDYANRVAFFHLDGGHVAHTCDRLEFIGRNGSLANPAALGRAGLSGRSGAMLDPCAALQTVVELQPGEEQELVFMLGVGGRRNLDAANMVRRHRGAAAAHDSFARMRAWWDETLHAVRIETPEPALDAIANGWLLYQTIACRLWARSSHYQSNGAYGFRDQLQDAMATVHARPELLRDHLLLFAGHQFVEGDVQHWWHPPLGRGARTRSADDALWLALAAHRYVSVTGDEALLDEIVPFVEGRPLVPGEAFAYELPADSVQQASLYEHCVRAIRHALAFGVHGLPLIGGGDWNEGLDRVGPEGRGESVWLGFFLYEVLERFAGLAERRADYGFATTCRSAAQVLAHHIEENAWDGEWYRRAWFDDGSALGTRDGTACRIDASAQSWAVLSGAAGPARARTAMAALDAHLVHGGAGAGAVRLLDPPFARQEEGQGIGDMPDPGTIRAYPPGVRENGGQVTEAAVWAAMAFARLGNGERAWDLLRMINPVSHTGSPAGCARYLAEPYVLADDVCTAAPHAGRGGWSWSTGAAGWMLRLIVESLLGVERTGERLALAPQLPASWDGFRLHYRYRGSMYTIDVIKGTEAGLIVDGAPQEDTAITLVDDGRPHQATLTVAGHGGACAAEPHPNTMCEK